MDAWVDVSEFLFFFLLQNNGNRILFERENDSDIYYSILL